LHADCGCADSRILSHCAGDLLQSTDQFHVFQFIQMLLGPANGVDQRPWGMVHYDLKGSALPIKKGAFRSARRADAGVVIGGWKSQIYVLRTRGATEHGAVREANCEPALLVSAHGIKSCQGNWGNRCRHQFCMAGAKEFQSTTRAGIDASPNCRMASAR